MVMLWKWSLGYANKCLSDCTIFRKKEELKNKKKLFHNTIKFKNYCYWVRKHFYTTAPGHQAAASRQTSATGGWLYTIAEAFGDNNDYNDAHDDDDDDVDADDDEWILYDELLTLKRD